MKKLSFVFAAVIAAVIASCGNGTPKANMKDDVDTLSYAIGMSQTQGLRDYLTRIGVDSAYMDEFIKGLNAGANAGDDKKKTAYYAGIQIGQQISQQMMKGINYELFGEDSTQTISLKNFMAGFVAGTLEEGGLMTMEGCHQEGSDGKGLRSLEEGERRFHGQDCQAGRSEQVGERRLLQGY